MLRNVTAEKNVTFIKPDNDTFFFIYYSNLLYHGMRQGERSDRRGSDDDGKAPDLS